MDRKNKTVFQLDTPFTDSTWPDVSMGAQETIIELLANLLSPIGNHRNMHVIKSKGKRAKKRKRAALDAEVSDASQPLTPPVPEISTYVVVGISSITRCLEEQCQKQRNSSTNESPTKPQTKQSQRGRVAAVFVPHLTGPAVMNLHLPRLIAAASRSGSEAQRIRLVRLPRSSEDRLTASLGVPRVSAIAVLEGAPHSKPLLDYIRTNVAEVKEEFFEQIQGASYLPVSINPIQTPIGKPRKEQKLAKASEKSAMT